MAALATFGLCACGGSIAHSSTATIPLPACSSTTAPVGHIEPAGAILSVDGSPFSVLSIAGTDFAVASATTGGAQPRGELELLRVASGSASIVRSSVLPGTTAADGMALSHNGRWLAVTTFDDTLLVSVANLIAGDADPVLGRLDDGASGQIEAAFSVDDDFLFVTDEDSDQLSVFNVERAVVNGFATSGVAVGRVLLSAGPVGIAVSPDGLWVYVTTEGPDGGPGFLWLLDAHIASQDPAAAIVSHVGAGCNPVRVALSPTGDMAWVTARASDALIGFSTNDLRTQPSRAVKAVVRVGLEPVGLALYDGGDDAIVANSARFATPEVPQNLTVVNLDAALAGRGAVVGWIAAGAFPREIVIDGAYGLVTNYGSSTVEIVPLPT
jgi:DNA-binding beta-propeller fold protein YncE